MIRRRLPKPMSKEEMQKRAEEMDLEKGDLPAMIIAAFLVFTPAVFGLIGLIVFMVYRFFVR